MVAVRRNNESGVALLATLLAIALMTFLVMELTTVASLGLRSASNQANELRARCLARSGVAIGLSLLAQDARDDLARHHPVDSLNEAWAQPIPPISMDGGKVTLTIVDDERKININMLVDSRNGRVNQNFEGIIERLFGQIGVSTDLIPAIIDWLDSDSIQTPGGAEADYYLRLRPPYAPRNGPMPTIGDLQMIRGINTAIFMQLRQFLTALPYSRVNVNTAPPQVLAALTPELAEDSDLVKQLVTARSERPFQNLTDVANLPGFGQVANRLLRLIEVRSNYFTLTAVGSYAGARRIVFATFRRNINGTAVLVGWQEQ